MEPFLVNILLFRRILRGTRGNKVAVVRAHFQSDASPLCQVPLGDGYSLSTFLPAPTLQQSVSLKRAS